MLTLAMRSTGDVLVESQMCASSPMRQIKELDCTLVESCCSSNSLFIAIIESPGQIMTKLKIEIV